MTNCPGSSRELVTYLRDNLLPAAQLKHLAALKKLDLPVEVRESKLVLIDDWACASKGSPLTAAQAKMLFHLDMRVHEFKPSILASYVDGVVGD